MRWLVKKCSNPLCSIFVSCTSKHSTNLGEEVFEVRVLDDFYAKRGVFANIKQSILEIVGLMHMFEARTIHD